VLEENAPAGVNGRDIFCPHPGGKGVAGKPLQPVGIIKLQYARRVGA
jgi:hypothetical protein